MTIYTEYMSGVYDWIVAVSGFAAGNVFRRNQENPDLGPDANWATYKEISGETRDYPLVKTVDNSPIINPGVQLDYTRVLPGTSMVSVNIYADNGADILRNMFLARTERATRAIFKTAKIVLLDMSGPRDLSELSDTKWKNRYQADFTFQVFTERVELDYIVDIVDLTGKVEQDTIEIYVDRNG